MIFIPLLQSPAGSAGSQYLFLGTLLVVFVIFYFLLIRPQKKEQQKTQAMIDALQKGDKIITIGGIHGVVSSTKERTLIVKIDENCKIEINRSAVGVVVASSDKKQASNEANTKKSSFFGKKNAHATNSTDTKN